MLTKKFNEVIIISSSNKFYKLVACIQTGWEKY